MDVFKLRTSSHWKTGSKSMSGMPASAGIFHSSVISSVLRKYNQIKTGKI